MTKEQVGYKDTMVVMEQKGMEGENGAIGPPGTDGFPGRNGETGRNGLPGAKVVLLKNVFMFIIIQLMFY